MIKIKITRTKSEAIYLPAQKINVRSRKKTSRSSTICQWRTIEIIHLKDNLNFK